jgi:hypothetical protein
VISKYNSKPGTIWSDGIDGLGIDQSYWILVVGGKTHRTSSSTSAATQVQLAQN